VPATKLSLPCGTQLLAVMALLQQVVRALAITIQQKSHYTYVMIFTPTNTQILAHVLHPVIR
jgi:hypothetical protein